MSVVTSIVLICGLEEPAVEWEYDSDIVRSSFIPFVGFTRVTDEGGTKALQMTVLTAACNYLDLPELIKAVEQVKWDEPGHVMLIVQREDEERPAVYTLNDDTDKLELRVEATR